MPLHGMPTPRPIVTSNVDQLDWSRFVLRFAHFLDRAVGEPQGWSIRVRRHAAEHPGTVALDSETRYR